MRERNHTRPAYARLRKGESRRDLIEDAGPIPDITEKQRKIALAMIRSELSLEDILERDCVTEEEFAEWISEGRFTKYSAELAAGFAEVDAACVWKVLLKLAKDGSVPAIKLYFDLSMKKSAANRSEKGNMTLDCLRQTVFGEDARDIRDIRDEGDDCEERE